MVLSRMVLDKIESSKGRFIIPKFKIVKPPQERKNGTTALNDIGVLDSPPFEESPIENAFFRKLDEADDNEL
jgi:hypothetical protein